MYNIITGIGNENINNELRKLNKYNVLFGDIAYQEAVLDVLEKNNIDKLILYERLSGEIEMNDFVEKIIKTKDNLDIIVILENKNKDFINFLISKGIFKIILADELTLDLLCKNIDNEIENVKEKKLYNEIVELKKRINNTKNVNIPFDKKVIAINGISGSGKTTFAINLALTITNEFKKRVLLVDLDTANATIDKMLDIPKLNNDLKTDLDMDKKSVLNYMVEAIQKTFFDYTVFEDSIITYPKEKNLDIITGNNSMFICQNVLCEKYYSEILNKAKQLYDFIVIDTSSNVFLDSTKWALENADCIYYIMQGNYTDISNMRNSFNIYTKMWDVLFNKVKFILNKQTRFSLNRQYLKDIETDLDIIKEFEYKDKYVECLNNGIPIVLTDIVEKEKYKEIIGIYERKPIFTKIATAIKGVF